MWPPGSLGGAAHIARLVLKVGGGGLHGRRRPPAPLRSSWVSPHPIPSSSIIQELLSSEQAFVGKLQFLQSHHMQHLDRCPHVPAAVASQKAVIFRNVQDISHFHSR